MDDNIGQKISIFKKSHPTKFLFLPLFPKFSSGYATGRLPCFCNLKSVRNKDCFAPAKLAQNVREVAEQKIVKLCHNQSVLLYCHAGGRFLLFGNRLENCYLATSIIHDQS